MIDRMKQAHFGIFHVEPCRHKEVFYDSLRSPYMDTYIINYWWDEALCLDAIRSAGQAGKRCFVSISAMAFDVDSPTAMVDVGDEHADQFRPRAALKPDWTDRLDRLVAAIRGADAWDGFAGFYMDEPMLWGCTTEQFKAVTGYPRQKWPDKGFFVCFSVAGVAPDVWTNGFAQPITPDAGQYLTDVAFDMYHPFDDSYAYIADQMKERLGRRDDLRIWYVPCTMDYRGDKDEAHCLDHLHGCYELLKQEANPGGLFCFTWHTFASSEEDLGNVGLDHLTDPDYPKYWPRLMAEIERIGCEIVQGDAFAGRTDAQPAAAVK